MPTQLSHLAQDLRYTLRQLRRAPVFTATAILTLALGISATTAVFSLVRATLLEALPYPHPEQLVGVGFVPLGEPPEAEQTGGTADLLLRESTSFASMGFADDSVFGQNLSFTDERGGLTSRPIRSLRVSAGYLPTLGIGPLLGRTFSRPDDTPGSAPTVVLSHSLWQRAFRADPQIVGRSLRLNSDLFTVIGVMPSSLATVDAPDLWQPLRLSPADPGYIGDNFQCLARLKPGSSVAQAAAELAALSPEIYRQVPDLHHWDGPGAPQRVERLWPLSQVLVREVRPSLLAVAAATLIVLLLACLNLAGLLTARVIARRGELAIRSALGATRLASLRLLLTESAVLAFAGAGLGLLLARALLPVVVRTAPLELPPLHPVTVDLHAALFAAGIGCLVTLLLSLLPASSLFRRSRQADLSYSRHLSTSALHRRLGSPLLLAQVTLAALLLGVGSLLLTTFLHLRAIPSGVVSHDLFALQVNLKGTAFRSSTHTQQYIAQVEDGLRALPGVAGVSTVNGLPLDRGLNNSGGPADHPERVAQVETRFVSPGYFATVGQVRLAGTDFSPDDTAKTAPVALINQRAARLWFPDRSAVGERILDGGEAFRVIGVVADAHNRSLAEAARPTVYLPFSQTADAEIAMINGWFPTTFLLRSAPSTDGAGAALFRAASGVLASVDANTPVSTFLPMERVIDRTVAAPRFFSWLVGSFAPFALLLTAMGLFGLLSYQVSARTREIGVRMALGSSRLRVIRLVVVNALLLTAAGVLFGSLAAYALRQPLVSTLATATRTDPSALVPLLGSPATPILVTLFALLAATAIAAIVPARRAASIDPNTALRAD